MRKDIRAINEAFSKVHKEQSDNTDMEAAPTSDKPGRLSTKFSIQRTNYDQIFYNKWEDIVDRLTDDVKNNKLPETQGFFFGYSSLDTDAINYDLIAIEKARQALENDYIVIYYSWW